MLFTPSEENIQRVMSETNMDWLRSSRHLQDRHYLQEQIRMQDQRKYNEAMASLRETFKQAV
jgi:hypothetical protein